MQTPVNIMSAPVNTAGDAALVKPTITDAAPSLAAAVKDTRETFLVEYVVTFESAEEFIAYFKENV